MHKTKNTYLFEREYDKENSGVVDEALKRYWTNILGAEVISDLKNLYGIDIDSTLIGTNTYTTNQKNLDEIQELSNNFFSKNWSGDKITYNGKDVVFGSFFSQLVEFSTELLPENTENSIVESFTDSVLTQLCKICISTLMFEMYILKKEKKLRGKDAVAEYVFFNKKYLRSKEYVKCIFEIYPCLERLIFECIRNALDNYKIFVDRLAQDHDLIVEKLCEGKNFSHILKIKGGISDSHKKGSSVFIVSLDNGYQIVYKPHSLECEEKYQTFLDFVSKGCKYTIGKYTILNCGKYGWEEYVQQADCHTEAEVKRYFYRFGMLIFANYILNTNDLHVENLIAVGETTIIIDTETILGNYRVDYAETARDRIHLIIQDSVLYSGLLPCYKYAQAGHGINMGAINGSAGDEYPITIPRIKDNFTSNMHFEYVHPVTEENSNQVILKGRSVDPTKYKQEVNEGFCDAYLNLLKRKKKALEAVKVFCNINIRYLVQDTQRYSMILHTSYHPDFLQNAMFRELMLCSLLKDYKKVQGNIEIVRSEIMDMLEMDIPYFYMNSSDTDLFDSRGKAIHKYFRESSFHYVEKKIKKLSRKDMTTQSIYLQIALTKLNELDFEQRVMRQVKSEHKAVDKSTITKSIMLITKCLMDKAIFSDDKSDVNWIGVFAGGESENATWQVRPLDNYLYEGLPGVAIFFAALNKIFSDDKYNQILEGISKALFTYTDEMYLRQRGSENESSGVFCGEASLLYTYEILYQLTSEEKYITYSKKQIEVVSKIVNSDQYFDIIYGNAGALLAILNMYKVFPEKKYLEMAISIGDSLIEKQEKNGGWKGKTSANELAGFSHGASGISYALYRLWHLTKEKKYCVSAKRGFLFENSLYDAQEGNWKDKRCFKDIQFGDNKKFMTSWCHGAAGILLSRVKCYDEMYLEEFLTKDIENAIKAIIRHGMFDNNCLCHGNLGNSEILSECAKNTGNLEAKKMSNILLNYAVNNILSGNFDCGRAYLFGHKIPGFMTGLAGMGYSLLRHIDETLPCILAIEL